MLPAKQKRHLKLAAEVRSLYAQVDQHLQNVPERDQVKCKRGCAACCRMMVVTTYPEAVALVTRYPREVERALPALRADWKITTEIATAAGLAVGEPRMLERGVQEWMCDAWWKLQRPCPFLSPESECTVYEARPLACRTYHVRTDPELCARVPATEGVEIMKLSATDDLQVIGAMGSAQARAIAGEFTCGPFAEMVLHARAQLRG